MIEVLSEDHLAERIDLSSVEPGMSRDITLETADGCLPVRLVWGGRPLGAQQILVCDVTDLDAQTSQAAQVGEDGMLPGQWLRYGRDYCIVATVQRGKQAEETAGRVQRFFRWLGQDEVDLEALPGQLDAFKTGLR